MPMPAKIAYVDASKTVTKLPAAVGPKLDTYIRVPAGFTASHKACKCSLR